MKTLIAISALFLSLSAAHAATYVNVVVDGEAYTCSKGGAGSVLCTCRAYQNGSYFYYAVDFSGEEAYVGPAHYKKAEALIACNKKIKELDYCKP